MHETAVVAVGDRRLAVDFLHLGLGCRRDVVLHIIFGGPLADALRIGAPARAATAALVGRPLFRLSPVGRRLFPDRCRFFSGGAAQQAACPGEAPLNELVRRSLARSGSIDRHAHHLLRHPIRLLLVLIAWLIDAQLRLRRHADQFLLLAFLAGTRQPAGSAAGAGPLQEARVASDTGLGSGSLVNGLCSHGRLRNVLNSTVSA